MFNHKKIILIYLLLFMLSGVYAEEKKVVATASFYTESHNASILSFVKDLNISVDKNQSLFSLVKIIDRATVDKKFLQLTGKTKINIHNKGEISPLAKSLGADLVVAGNVRFIPKSYSLQLQAVIYDTKKNHRVKLITKTARFERRDSLVTDFLNSISISIKQYYRFGNISFSESVIKLSNKKEVVKGVQRVPLTEDKYSRATADDARNSRKLTVDMLFKFNYVPEVFGLATSNYLGVDVIFSLDNSFFAFGIGSDLRLTDSLELDIFVERHFLRNSYDRHFQVYMRIGGGVSFPLASTVDIDYKIGASLGFRISFAMFIFDFASGFDYFMNQDNSFFISGGIGLHL